MLFASEKSTNPVGSSIVDTGILFSISHATVRRRRRIFGLGLTLAPHLLVTPTLVSIHQWVRITERLPIRMPNSHKNTFVRHELVGKCSDQKSKTNRKIYTREWLLDSCCIGAGLCGWIAVGQTTGGACFKTVSTMLRLRRWWWSMGRSISSKGREDDGRTTGDSEGRTALMQEREGVGSGHNKKGAVPPCQSVPFAPLSIRPPGLRPFIPKIRVYCTFAAPRQHNNQWVHSDVGQLTLLTAHSLALFKTLTQSATTVHCS